MTSRKPTSIRDLTLTVSCVSHPKLKPEHRVLLLALAPFADYTTGEHARPTFDFLAAAMQCSKETVRRRVRHCEGLGLIEVTRTPDGKGIATEWRICLENPAYPDSYPTFKGPRDAVDQEQAVRSTENRFSSTNSHSIGPQKTGLAPQKTGLGPQVGVDPPTTTPTSTASTSTVQHKHTVEQIKQLRRWMQRTNEERNGQRLRARKEDWQTLAENLADYGPALVRLAWKSFLEADDLPNGWKFPLIPFNESFAGYLQRAESERASPALRDELWRYRQHLTMLHFGGGFAYGFLDVMADAEKQVYDRHLDYMRRTRDGDPAKQIAGIDLSCAGDLERLQTRADQWMKDNAETVARLQAEEEAWLKNPVANSESDEETAQ